MESIFGRTDSKSLKMGFTTALVVSACIVDALVIAYDGSVMGSVNVGQFNMLSSLCRLILLT
jgi:hypothetical protein